MLLLLGAPELAAALQVGPYKAGRGIIPSVDLLLATPLATAQDAVGLLGCKYALLTQAKLLVHQNPKSSLQSWSQ